MENEHKNPGLNAIRGGVGTAIAMFLFEQVASQATQLDATLGRGASLLSLISLGCVGVGLLFYTLANAGVSISELGRRIQEKRKIRRTKSLL